MSATYLDLHEEAVAELNQAAKERGKQLVKSRITEIIAARETLRRMEEDYDELMARPIDGICCPSDEDCDCTEDYDPCEV